MKAAGEGLRDFIEDQLQDLGALAFRRMFGGYGLYHAGIFFGILYKGRLYFKTDAASRGEYSARGMQPFRPNRRQTLTSYYEVPVEIMEDREALTAWAQTAVGVQAVRRR